MEVEYGAGRLVYEFPEEEERVLCNFVERRKIYGFMYCYIEMEENDRAGVEEKNKRRTK